MLEESDIILRRCSVREPSLSVIPVFAYAGGLGQGERRGTLSVRGALERSLDSGKVVCVVLPDSDLRLILKAGRAGRRTKAALGNAGRRRWFIFTKSNLIQFARLSSGRHDSKQF
jgi:hypothetical protein